MCDNLDFTDDYSCVNCSFYLFSSHIFCIGHEPCLLWTEVGGLFFSWFNKSVCITILFTIISVLLSAMVGYGVQMYEFRGRKVIIIMIMSTMMIPLETLMIPLYNEVSKMHLLNTYMGVVLPFAVSAFTIYFFMQFAHSLSHEYMDAARIDGCGEIRIFTKIMGRLMKPAFASMIILQATTAWNDFLWPLIVMSKNDRFTLSVACRPICHRMDTTITYFLPVQYYL